MDRVVQEVIAAVENQQWPQVRAMLHPYLHWKEAQVETRGRSKVMARLVAGPTPSAPASYELRDGQVYRWTSG